MATRYHFITDIELGAPRQQVWEALARSEAWPTWWRWLRQVEVVTEGDADGMGRRVRNQVGSPLRYALTYVGEVTRALEPELVEFHASGDLVGIGQFRLHPAPESGTQVTFTWLVETPKWWMNLLAPLARPVFAWSHHRLMVDFAHGLAQSTGAEMRRVANQSLRPRSEGFFRLPKTG